MAKPMPPLRHAEFSRMENLGISPAELARLAGVPRGYVSNYFNGNWEKIGRPGLKKIRHTLKGCGVVRGSRRKRKNRLPVGCIMP